MRQTRFGLLSRLSAYSGAIRDTKERLLSRAKAVNPQLTTWDKAIDPSYKVSEISTRAGKRQVRPFQPPLPLLKVLQGGGLPNPDESNEETRSASLERLASSESRDLDSRSALQVPVEPSGSGSVPTPNQLPVGAANTHQGDGGEGTQEVKITYGMLNDIQETVAGMKRFLQSMEDREARSQWEERDQGRQVDSPTETTDYGRPPAKDDRNGDGTNRGRASPTTLPQSPWASTRSTPIHPARFLAMLGAAEKKKSSAEQSPPDFSRPPPAIPEETEEEDECYKHFERMYEEECEEIEEVDLGPDFVYPTQKAFDKFIGEFDFMKHLKHGTLTKFDGTVKGYLTFKRNFFRLVYAQRIGYLHKLLALEYMVP